MTDAHGRTSSDGNGKSKSASAASRHVLWHIRECARPRRTSAGVLAAWTVARQRGALSDQDDSGFVRIRLPLGQALSCRGNESLPACGLSGRGTRFSSLCRRGDSRIAEETGATWLPDPGSHGKDLWRLGSLSETELLCGKPRRQKCCRRSVVDEKRRDSCGRARNRGNAGEKDCL